MRGNEFQARSDSIGDCLRTTTHKRAFPLVTYPQKYDGIYLSEFWINPVIY
jgi:hypothetical protein